MTELDERLRRALAEQLAQRRRILDGGAAHVGWKLGMGERESVGGEIAVGYLTSATVLEPGATYAAAAGVALHADCELAVEIGAELGITRCAVALELVDLAELEGEPGSVVAANVFHRAVVFGPWRDGPSPRGREGRVVVNGDVLATGEVPHVDDRLARAARLLRAVGEDLRPGDRVITGSIVQVPLRAGDHAVAELDGLGRAAARTAAVR